MAMQDRINDGRRRLAGYLTENQVALSERLSRAEQVANRQTKDRYQPQVAKARNKAEEVIAKLAQPPT